MNDIKGIPYTQVHFDKSGKQLNEPNIPPGTTDLIVASHGWNNDEDRAVELYTKLFSNFADATKHDPAYAGRKVAILGIIWPAKKFDSLMSHIQGSGLDTGGAKSLSAGDKAEAEKTMREAIQRVAPLFADPGDEVRLATFKSLEELVPVLETDGAAQKKFVQTLRELLQRGASTDDQVHREDSSDVLFEGDPALVFSEATRSAPASGSGGPPPPAMVPAAGQGGALGFGNFFSKAANAVTNLMNLTTYFEMKQRAGTVGKNGVGPMIDALENQVMRIHLVGHSFGGRVVTSAAANSATNKLHSLSLLQAAFSHNGFSRKRNGFFRSVVTNKRITGPILVTHTKNDKAVGLAYPAASRISGDAAAGFGDADDKFGGIGSNGAQEMDDGETSTSADSLMDVNGAYAFQAGKIHNLKSDAFIVDPAGGDAHGFVYVPQVAWAISRGILT